ncbi:MAG: hypothetical protein ISF22_02955 [Methanomassiliicoccus sp.]|nr:hypothetical protein [Methanomassiliicoccus sp.]
MFGRRSKRNEGDEAARSPGHENAISEYGYIRIAGAAVGLVSLLLPWGSIIQRDDTFATVSTTAVGMWDLLTSPDLVIAASSFFFIAATMLAFIDARAVIGQIAAFAALFLTIPGLLAGKVAAMPPLPPGWTVTTTSSMGLYVGLLSIVLVLITFLPERRKVRREEMGGLLGSEGLRPEENAYNRGIFSGRRLR